MASKISLFVEDTDIKLLLTSGGQVEKWETVTLEAGLVVEGVVQDQARVAQSIKELLKRQGVKGNSVIAGISGLNSVSRILTFPEVPKNLLAEAVTNEASRVLPMPLSQVYYSYQLLPTAKGEMRLFLIAYPRNSTDALLGTIKQAGLKVKSIDIAPLALARCVNANQSILVNSGAGYIDIVILSERIPLVSRSIPLPTDETSPDERLDSITEELTRTITFYNSTYPDKVLDKSVEVVVSGVLLTGKDALKHLETLERPIKTIDPPLGHTDAFDPAQYSVNIGLALKGQLPGGASSNYSVIDFNALPKAYQEQPFNFGAVLVPVVAAAAVGAIVYGGFALNTLRHDTALLTSQYAQMQNQSDAQSKANAKVQSDITAQQGNSKALSAQSDTIQSQIDAANADLAFFNGAFTGLKADLKDISLDTAEVVKDIPSGLVVMSIDVGGSSISVTGVSPSQALILTYAKNLRSSGRFNSVAISSIDSSDPQNLKFEISLS